MILVQGNQLDCCLSGRNRLLCVPELTHWEVLLTGQHHVQRIAALQAELVLAWMQQHDWAVLAVQDSWLLLRVFLGVHSHSGPGKGPVVLPPTGWADGRGVTSSCLCLAAVDTAVELG